MLQLENKTPFVPGLFVFPDASGVDTLYAVVKATFAIEPGGLRIAPKQVPVAAADRYWGEPGKSSLRYAGEAHLPKPATDVALVGSAHAPGGKAAQSFGVSFSVGAMKKVLHVHGDRIWKAGTLGLAASSPEPMASVPLLWERAYGGRDEAQGGKPTCEAANPVGRGHLGGRKARDLIGTPLPNLELPSAPVTEPGVRVPPAGVGFIAPTWQPRVAFAGTYNEAWTKSRAPYLPKDFDPRFFQAVPADQVYRPALQGGEPVELVNLSPAGRLRFALPTCTLGVEIRVAGKVERPPLAIETLLLEPDEGRLTLLWRCALPCDKRVLQVERITCSLDSLSGVLA